MYKRGLGVPQDYNKAMDYFIKSADQGDESAHRNIGIHSFNFTFIADMDSL